MNGRRSGFLAIKLALGLLGLWLVIRSISLDQLEQAFAHLSWIWLLAALAVTSIEFAIASAKVGWMVGDPSFAHQFKIVCVKTFMNQFLPGGLGGEAARLFFLGRFLKSSGRAFAIVFQDRWSGLCGQMIWSGLGLTLFVWLAPVPLSSPPLPPLSPATALPSSLPIPLSAVILVLWTLGLLGWFAGPFLLSRAVPLLPWLKNLGGFPKVELESQTFQRELAYWSSLTSKSVPLFLWVCLNQVANVLLLYTSCRALGGNVPVLLASALMLFGALASLLPLTLGNLGVQEAFFGIGFHASGMDAELGVGVSLLFRVMQIVPVGLGLLFFIKGFRPPATAT
jgi:glycosyltransferase 2 family protein